MKRFFCFFILLLALLCLTSCDDAETPSPNPPSSEHVHAFGEWSESKAATCTAKGEEKRSCACGVSETREITITEHTYGEWSESKAATCAAKGEEQRSCACGASETREVTMLDHTYGEWITLTPATCAAKGAKMHICPCGASASAEIPATGAHQFGTENKCTVCALPAVYTAGMEYSLNRDGASYALIGMGSATATDVIIPAYHEGKPVTAIAGTFDNYPTLKSLTLPTTITSIYKSAWSGCEQLSAIYINSIEQWFDMEIGYMQTFSLRRATFEEPDWEDVELRPEEDKNQSDITVHRRELLFGKDLYVSGVLVTEITFPDGTTAVDSRFQGCRSLQKILIPEGVTEIGYSAFEACSSLQSVTLPESITYISDIFKNCTALRTITIPKSVTWVSPYAFEGCTALESITVEPGNTKYHSSGNCLIDTECKELVLGCKNSVIPTDGSVTSICYNAFTDCSALTTLTIPDTVVLLYPETFAGCDALIQKENGVYYVDKWAIGCDDDLGTLVIRPGTIGVASGAFFDKQALISVNIPNSLTILMSAGYEYNPFLGCSSLESIVVENGNPVYHSVGNCLIETQGKMLITGCKNSVIPADGSVLYIGVAAFYGCTALSSIVIPASVTHIMDIAFYNCSALTSITFAENSQLETISSGAFRCCTSLTSITIPASVTCIGAYTFEGCTSLTSVTFAEKEGWVATCEKMADVVLEPTDLSDPAEVAEYFTQYPHYVWERTLE